MSSQLASRGEMLALLGIDGRGFLERVLHLGRKGYPLVDHSAFSWERRTDSIRVQVPSGRPIEISRVDGTWRVSFPDNPDLENLSCDLFGEDHEHLNHPAYTLAMFIYAAQASSYEALYNKLAQRAEQANTLG